MPTYEYECKSCSYGFERFQAMSDQPVKECPKCGQEVRRLIFGGAGVIFKGSGFYVTDKSKTAKTRSKTDKPDSTGNEAPVSGGKTCAGCSEAAKCPASSESSRSSVDRSGESKSA